MPDPSFYLNKPTKKQKKKFHSDFRVGVGRLLENKTNGGFWK